MHVHVRNAHRSKDTGRQGGDIRRNVTLSSFRVTNVALEKQ